MIMENAPINNLEDPTPLQTEKHISIKFIEQEQHQTQPHTTKNSATKFSSEKRIT